MQISTCLETSAEPYVVQVIELYILSTSNPPPCTNHIQCVTNKPKSKRLNFLKTKHNIMGLPSPTFMTNSFRTTATDGNASFIDFIEDI